jgi:hypothetical protein
MNYFQKSLIPTTSFFNKSKQSKRGYFKSTSHIKRNHINKDINEEEKEKHSPLEKRH